MALFASLGRAAYGAPPSEPLPAPLYSFDADSPTVKGGYVDADGILHLGFPHPDMMHGGGMLGMGMTGDDLDAMSVSNAGFSTSTTFVLMFSVDGATQGVAAPDPSLVAAMVPYNVTDQAARGQAAGDQFMSITLFTLGAGGRSVSELISNNTLLRNNFDEGGNDFSAEPPTSAEDVVEGAAQDTVDATVGALDLAEVYYSASAGSPSLEHLPGSGSPSGAHVILHTFGPRQHSLYASYQDLGLQQDDDIDGLIVFDLDGDGVFGGADRVLFSLTPASPSLLTIPGASGTGAAADVFVAAPGSAPAVFASAAVLGLGDVQDNIDALEYLLCDDGVACAVAHGIRRLNPVPTLSEWGVGVMALMLIVAATLLLRRCRQEDIRSGSVGRP